MIFIDYFLIYIIKINEINPFKIVISCCIFNIEKAAKQTPLFLHQKNERI